MSFTILKEDLRIIIFVSEEIGQNLYMIENIKYIHEKSALISSIVYIEYFNLVFLNSSSEELFHIVLDLWAVMHRKVNLLSV